MLESFTGWFLGASRGEQVEGREWVQEGYFSSPIASEFKNFKQI